jgi:hypothetical protein
MGHPAPGKAAGERSWFPTLNAKNAFRMGHPAGAGNGFDLIWRHGCRQYSRLGSRRYIWKPALRFEAGAKNDECYE